MIKVVLVDDEMLVRMGLKAAVDWAGLGFEVVGDACDGEQGVELCRALSPQLVITDIMMPKLDGLEMIRQIKAFAPKTRFIVLSSYNEFELVKKAMQLGAKDYLLKLSMGSESVSEMLLCMREELLQEAGAPVEAHSQSQSLLQEELLRDIVGNILHNADIMKARAAALSLPLRQEWMRVAIIKLKHDSVCERYQGSDSKLLDFMVLEILQEMGNGFCCCRFFKWSFLHYGMIYSPAREQSVEEFEQNCTDMYPVMIQMLGEYLKLSAAVSVSESVESLPLLKDAFLQAYSCSEQTFSLGYGQVICAKSEQSPAVTPPLSEKPMFRPALSKALEGSDSESVRAIFFELISFAAGWETTAPSELWDYCNHIAGYTDMNLSELWLSYKQQWPFALDVSALFSLQTKDEIIGWLQGYADCLYSFLEKDNQDEKNLLVARAKRYILANITEPISLKSVAGQLSISPGYLSSIFTKYAGVCFTDYVNQMKIVEAQIRIREGTDKIYQISYQLGYENACYFSKIFRRFSGCSPTEYQSRHAK